MKKLVFALALATVAGAANADTIFDGIYSDAAQTTLRTDSISATDAFTNSFFTGNKYIGGFFTTGSAAASLSYIQFQYQNVSASPLSSPFTGTVEIFSTVNTELVTNPGSSNPAFSSMVLEASFSQASTAAAHTSGIGGFSLATPLALDPSHLYGFAIKINGTDVVPTFTYGGYAPGSVGYAGYNNVVYGLYGAAHANDKGGDIPVYNGVSFGNFGSGIPAGQNVGYALYSAAPVPEPASMAALGLGALAMLRRRKRS